MKEKTFYVALHNVRSLYNVGSIFRTADAFLVDKIILGGYTGAPPRKEISKTALGAQTWIPYEKSFRLGKKLSELKQRGFHCVGLENRRKGAISLNHFTPQFPLLLVLGNEVRGIGTLIAKELEKIVYIPMLGKKESLNVAVAFGIAAWHIRMKSKFQNPNDKSMTKSKIQNTFDI